MIKILRILLLFIYSSLCLMSYENDTKISAISLSLTAEPIINSNYLDLQIYLQSLGDDFNLGLSSIGVVFDSKVLKYIGLIEEKPMLFSNNSSKGYQKTISLPDVNDPNPIPNLRTIEILYDTTTKPKPTGIALPKTKTYLGTLRFDILNRRAIYKFSWHPQTVIRTINNTIITALCEKNPINDIVIYKSNLTAPVGGESLFTNKKFDIKWTTTGNYPIFIEFTSDGTNWTAIDNKTTASSKLIYNWITPKVNSSYCKIRLIDSATSFVLSESNFFSIFDGFAQIVRPASGDAVYIAGKTDYIKWAVSGYSKLKFEYSLDGGSTWKVVVGPVDAQIGQAGWKIPTATTKSAIMRMIDIETNTVIAESGKFKILQGTLTFKNPVASETVINGKTYRIRWNVNDIQTFDLDFSTDNGANWENIKPTIAASSGYYDWQVPQLETKSAMLRATWNGDPEMEFGKSGTFILKNSPPVSVNDYDIITISLQPNPASDYLFINLNNSINAKDQAIEIFNLFGESQKLPTNFDQSNNLDNIKIDISNLEKGIYFLKFGNAVQKFIKY